MSAATTEPMLQEQAPELLSHAAGYASHRTIGMGLRTGLIRALAQAPGGQTPGELAEALDLDPYYLDVWCRSALGAGVCQRDGNRYVLAPHMDTLLLDRTSPAYIGGVFLVFEQHELFDRFEQVFSSGERLWWDETSEALIDPGGEHVATGSSNIHTARNDGDNDIRVVAVVLGADAEDPLTIPADPDEAAALDEACDVITPGHGDGH